MVKITALLLKRAQQARTTRVPRAPTKLTAEQPALFLSDHPYSSHRVKPLWNVLPLVTSLLLLKIAQARTRIARARTKLTAEQ